MSELKEQRSNLAAESPLQSQKGLNQSLVRTDGFWTNLCRTLLDHTKSGNKENIPGIKTILGEGPVSIAFIPEEEPNCLIKVIKRGQQPFGLTVDQEFSLMKEIKKLEGELYSTPTPFSWGNDPFYIAMEYLGDAVNQDIFVSRNVQKIGEALGEFSAELYIKYKSVHTDLSSNNYTYAPNGKIGIIDIASIQKTDIPEKMFVHPLRNSLDLCIAMAEKYDASIEEYNSKAGHAPLPLINLEKVEKVCYASLSNVSPRFREDYKNAYKTNLEKWHMSIQQNALPKRPKPEGLHPASNIHG